MTTILICTHCGNPVTADAFGALAQHLFCTADNEVKMSDQYYVCIASSKNKDHVRLCHGPCTEERAMQAVQEINSRLSYEPFAYIVKWPEAAVESGK